MSCKQYDLIFILPNPSQDALSQGMFQTLPSVPKKPDLSPDSDDMPEFQTSGPRS